MPAGRPKKEFDKKLFIDLVGIGAEQDEICWIFRDDSGKPANRDTLSRWCKNEFGLNFQEYSKQNKAMALKIKLRRNQLKLSEKSAAMAIWLGKQYLGQHDRDISDAVNTANGVLESILALERRDDNME